MRSPNHATVKLLPSVLTSTNLSLINEQEKDEGVEISSLTDTRFYMSHKTLASVLRTMVDDTLKYHNLEKQDLVQQFSIYFETLGWKTEDYMTAINNERPSDVQT